MSIRKNTTINLFGAVLPTVVTLVTVPLYLGFIGPERYGVLAILWSLMGYFGFLDLGLGRAIAQRLASNKAETNSDRNALLWTGLIITTSVGLIAGTLLWQLSDIILENWIEVSASQLQEVKGATIWFIAAMPLVLSNPVLSGALHGRQKFFAMNLVTFIGSTLAQLFPLAVAANGNIGLDFLVPATLLAQLVTLTLNLAQCQRHVPITLRPKFKFEYVRSLISFGGWVSLSSLFAPLLTAIDRTIIGIISGLTAVTQFTIPYQLASKLTILSASYSSALFPQMSGEQAGVRTGLLPERIRVLSTTTAPFCIVACYLAEWFFSIWISAEFAQKVTSLTLFLVLGFYFNSLAVVLFNYVQAIGRPDLVAKSQAAQLPVYLVLLYLLLSAFGVLGAAVATAMRMILGFSILQVIVKLYGQIWRAIWVPSLMVICAVVLNFINLPGVPNLIIGVVITSASIMFAIRIYARFVVDERS